MKEIAMLLFAHEVSHENHSIIPENVPYPFHLLNILEDERIERLAEKKWGVDFKRLHQTSFDVYYRPIDYFSIFNPYNLIVLHRWSRWSEKVKKAVDKAIEKGLKEKSLTYLPVEPDRFEEFREDIEKVLDDATNSESTEKMIENTIWFYEKWKEVFEFKGKGIKMGIGHGSGESAGDIDEEDIKQRLSKEAKEFIEEEMRKEDEEAEREWSTYDRNAQIEESSWYFMDEPVWSFDREKVEFLKKHIRKIRWSSKQTQVERTMLGRRPDARKVENLLPNPMRRRIEKIDTHEPKVLFVIDGSGSMNGYPYHNAIHIAAAFMEVFKDRVSVVITLDNGKYYPVKSVDDMLRYKCNGGTEYLDSVRDLVKKFDIVIFFTDACVTEEDEEFLKSIKSDTVIGMLTTMSVKEARNWLPKHFKKVVIARDIKGLVKEMAFLIRRRK